MVRGTAFSAAILLLFIKIILFIINSVVNKQLLMSSKPSVGQLLLLLPMLYGFGSLDPIGSHCGSG